MSGEREDRVSSGQAGLGLGDVAAEWEVGYKQTCMHPIIFLCVCVCVCVCVWCLQVCLADGVHKVCLEHGTTSGKRVISVDGKEVNYSLPLPQYYTPFFHFFLKKFSDFQKKMDVFAGWV